MYAYSSVYRWQWPDNASADDSNSGFDLFEIFSFEGYYNPNITRYFKAVWLEGDSYNLGGSMDFSVWLEFFADGIQDELRRVRKALSKPISKPRQALHYQQILD